MGWNRTQCCHQFSHPEAEKGANIGLNSIQGRWQIQGPRLNEIKVGTTGDDAICRSAEETTAVEGQCACKGCMAVAQFPLVASSKPRLLQYSLQGHVTGTIHHIFLSRGSYTHLSFSLINQSSPIRNSILTPTPFQQCRLAISPPAALTVAWPDPAPASPFKFPMQLRDTKHIFKEKLTLLSVAIVQLRLRGKSVQLFKSRHPPPAASFPPTGNPLNTKPNKPPHRLELASESLGSGY